MGRVSTARERLVETTRELVRARGYGGVGVAEICAEAGVQKGSFYHFFASKEALAEAAIRETWAEERRDWLTHLEADGRGPLERLEALFNAQVATQCELYRGAGTVLGCLYGNLALEVSSTDEHLRGTLQEVVDEQVDLIRAVLAAAASAGELSDERAGIDTARALIAHLEGSVLLARLHNQPALLDGLWAQARRLLA